MTPQQLTALKTGEIDLIDWISQYCDRVEQDDSEIQAMVSPTYQRQRILDDARRLLENYPSEEKPPLFGMTVGIKDIIHCNGFKTLCGSALPPHLFQGEQASCVSRLKAAGAIVMGKTHTTEFAFHGPGPTRNPHNLNHTPGGSSSGSAAGMVRDFFSISLGTQTGGSVIRPAAYCGIIGFKPTLHRIPTDGVVPYSKTVDHLGFYCKNVSLLPIISSVLLDQWNTNVNFEKDQWIFGIPEGPYLKQTSANGSIQFFKAIERLKKQGVTIKSCPALGKIHSINQTHRQLISTEIARVHQAWYHQYRDLYQKVTQKTIEFGQTISDVTLGELLQQRLENINEITAELDLYQIDFWIAPSAVDHADEGLAFTGDPIMNLPWTHAGMPAVSLPTGFDDVGLPHGIQIVGKPWDDERMVQAVEFLSRHL